MAEDNIQITPEEQDNIIMFFLQNKAELHKLQAENKRLKEDLQFLHIALNTLRDETTIVIKKAKQALKE